MLLQAYKEAGNVNISTISFDGNEWMAPVSTKVARSNFGPGLTFVSGSFLMAFIEGPEVFLTVSRDGSSWTPPQRTGFSGTGNVALTENRNVAWLGFNSTTNDMIRLVEYPTLGRPGTIVDTGFKSLNGPSLSFYLGNLFLAYVNSADNQIMVSRITAGRPVNNVATGVTSKLEPAIVTDGKFLYLVYVDSKTSLISFMVSSDGVRWTPMTVSKFQSDIGLDSAFDGKLQHIGFSAAGTDRLDDLIGIPPNTEYSAQPTLGSTDQRPGITAVGIVK